MSLQFWTVSLVPQARAAVGGMGPVEGETIHFLLQVVLWAEAAVMLVAGVYLFLLNRVSEPLWPWRPVAVSARIMAGWPLAWAAWAPTLALAKTWAEASGGVLLNIIWLGNVGISLFVFRPRFDFSHLAVRAYGAVTGALFALLLNGYLLQAL